MVTRNGGIVSLNRELYTVTVNDYMKQWEKNINGNYKR